MNEKDNIKINDDLIRRALQLEVELVELPDSDKMWLSIESRLAVTPTPLKENSSIWMRYAGLAAAACLLLVSGFFGLTQVMQFASPASEYDAAAEFLAIDQEEPTAESDLAASEAPEDPSVAAVPATGSDSKGDQQDQETDTITAAGPDQESADQQLTAAASSPVEERTAVFWPEKLGEEHYFSEEIVLPPVEDEHLRVALYSGPENDLLMVRSGTAEEDPKGFVEKIGLQMQFPINDIQYRDGYLFFVAGGYKGLVFHYDGIYRAIMAPLSTIKEEQLINLAAPFR